MSLRFLHWRRVWAQKGAGAAAKSYRELFPRLRGVKPQSGGGLGRPPEDIIQGRLVLATLKPEFAGI